MNKKLEDLLEEIIIIDLETTGLNYYVDAIIEIGICKLNLRTGNIEPIFSKICQEQDKNIPHDAWVFQNSDLNYDDVIQAPDIEIFREELQHLFNKYYMTAYNQSFDFDFLKLRGFEIRKRFWDPMFKLQYLLKIPYWNGDYKWPSFQEAWNYFFPNSNYKETHRALDDAIHEAQIVYEYYKISNQDKQKRKESISEKPTLIHRDEERAIDDNSSLFPDSKQKGD